MYMYPPIRQPLQIISNSDDNFRQILIDKVKESVMKSEWSAVIRVPGPP